MYVVYTQGVRCFATLVALSTGRGKFCVSDLQKCSPCGKNGEEDDAGADGQLLFQQQPTGALRAPRSDGAL